jgi:hypothetical protein
MKSSGSRYPAVSDSGRSAKREGCAARDRREVRASVLRTEPADTRGACARLHLPAGPKRAGGVVPPSCSSELGRGVQLTIARGGSGRGACARVRLTARLPSHATCPAGLGSACVARCWAESDRLFRFLRAALARMTNRDAAPISAVGAQETRPPGATFKSFRRRSNSKPKA